MADITDRNMLRLDLNMLKVLAVLVQEQSVTQAASRLCVTQSAASNMLSRLRKAVGDPILVRCGNSMVPTKRATRIAASVWQHLEAMSGALAGVPSFDPRHTYRLFRVGMPDYLAQTLLPVFSRRFASEAPCAQLIVRHASAEDYDRLLDDGDADVVVSMIRACRPHHQSVRLVEERYLCLHDADVLLEQPLTLTTYLGRPHVFVSFTGNLSGPVDAALGRLGHARRIAVATPSFALVPALLKGSGYLSTVPGPFARYCERTFGLRAAPLPFAIDPIPVSMAWHRTASTDPGSAWFRAEIASAVAREIGPETRSAARGASGRQNRSAPTRGQASRSPHAG